MKKIILTGERPTGKLHLGHYFGALKKRVEMQKDYETNIIIADVQGLTDNYENPGKVRENVYEVVMDNLAVGMDPDKTTFFIQSMIPEIAELTVFYSNLVTVSRLYRNPTVKGEVEQKRELFGTDGSSLTYGFLGYPVSQAADITVFGASMVPVGEDQLPMIEQTREIVRKFNSIYGETLTLPEAVVGDVARLKGLDGNAKMGKSLGNALYLSDSDEIIKNKIISALTDTNKIKVDDKADPSKCMVYYYHELLSKENINTICNECKEGSRGCVACKKELIQNTCEFISPIREKRKYYEDNIHVVEQILKDGTARARIKAQETMAKVKKAMKIDYFN